MSATKKIIHLFEANKKIDNLIKYNELLSEFEGVETLFQSFITNSFENYRLNNSNKFNNEKHINTKESLAIIAEVIKDVKSSISVNIINQLLVVYKDMATIDRLIFQNTTIIVIDAISNINRSYYENSYSDDDIDVTEMIAKMQQE